MTRLIPIALLVVAIGVGGSTPAAAQTYCGPGGSFVSTTVQGDIIVNAYPGICSIGFTTVTGRIVIVSGTLEMFGVPGATNVFGDIRAALGTSIVGEGTTVFGNIFTDQVADLNIDQFTVGGVVEAKYGARLRIVDSDLQGLKLEGAETVTVLGNNVGNKAEIKGAMTLTLQFNVGGELIVERGQVVELVQNTALRSIKVVGSEISAVVSMNRSPTIECSNNTSLAEGGNTALKLLCVN